MSRFERILARLAARGHLYDATPMAPEEWERLVAEQPDIPRTSEQIQALFAPLYGENPRPGSPTMDMLRIQQGLRNPALEDEHLDALDSHLDDRLPLLAESYESAYFYVKYDTTGDGATTAEIAQSTAEHLDSHYRLFLGVLGKAPHAGSAHGTKQIVEITSLAPGVDGVSSPTGPLQLSNVSVAAASNRKRATARELFHYVEYAFGLDADRFNGPSDGWFIEGCAYWAGTYATSGGVDGYIDIDFQDYWRTPIFRSQWGGYSAFPLWAYLQGFDAPAHDRSDTWVIRAFLESYESCGDPMAALTPVLQKAGDGLAEDQIDIPALIAHYTTAKASGRWREAGLAYDRSVMVRYFDRLTDSSDGSSYPTPTLLPTADKEIPASGPATFDSQALSPGTAQLIKGFFPAGGAAGRKVRVTVTNDGAHPVAATAVLVSKSSPDTPPGTPGSVYRAKAGTTTRQQQWDLPITNPTYDTVDVAIADGRLGAATITGDIPYTLTLEIIEP